jgi:hypothetical protein
VAAILVAVGGPIAAQTSQAPAPSQAACATEITSAANALLAGINSARALELAEQAPQFEADVAGHGYQFLTVGAVASFNAATCSDVTLSKLSVDFTIAGLYITTRNTTVPQGITVFENPTSTSVLSVTMDNSSVQGLNYFSGYEAQYVVSGTAYPLLETQQYYYQPSIGANSCCYTYPCWYNSALQCGMSMWSGISGAYGGGGFLIQSGTDNLMQCNSAGTCGSPVYSAWWEWVPQGPPYTYGGTLLPGDWITPMEENMYYSGGSLNTYQANVIDWTQSWTGLSGNLNVGKSAYWSQSEIEIPSTGTVALPTFNSITFTNVGLCWGTSSCAWWGSTGNIPITTDSMINYCPSSGSNVYNILLSSVNSVGDYTQTYNTNCGT